ncbi:unnamed protein product, partial [Closterium sp. Yama58-4]
MPRRSTHCLASLVFLCAFLCLISAKSQPQRDTHAHRRRDGLQTSRFSSQQRTVLVDTPPINPALRGDVSVDKREGSFIVRAEPVPKRILRVVSPEFAHAGRRRLKGAENAAAAEKESGETWTEAEEHALVIPKGVAFYHRGKNSGGGGGSGGAGTRLAAPIDITPGKGGRGKRGGQASGGTSDSGAGKFPVITPGGKNSTGSGGGRTGGGGIPPKKKRGGPNGGWTLGKERRVSLASAQEMKFGNGQFGKGGKVTYHGGPVMTKSPIKVYLIFYGDWDATTVQLFHKFVDSISGKYKTPADRYNVTRWWDLTAAGTQADGKRVSSTVSLGKSVLDRNYVSGGGKVLRNYQKDVVAIINYHLRNKLLPFDTDGIYMVMTDPTVEVKSSDPKDGFCTRFCGYHSYGQDALGKALKFGFAGHSARCPSQCTRPLPYDTFNGINVDATISTFAHEIAEVAQDPLFTAWYDHDQVEGADKCTYIYGDGWKLRASLLATAPTTIAASSRYSCSYGLTDLREEPSRGTDFYGEIDIRHPEAAMSAPPLASFVPVPPNCHFPIQNLPFGVFRPSPGGSARVGVAIGEQVLDLSVVADAGLLGEVGDDVVKATGCFHQASLNAFMALGRPVWQRTRTALQRLLSADEPALRDNKPLRAKAFHPQARVQMELPAVIGDYTDFYASRHHATNVGRLFRGPGNELPKQ